MKSIIASAFLFSLSVFGFFHISVAAAEPAVGKGAVSSLQAEGEREDDLSIAPSAELSVASLARPAIAAKATTKQPAITKKAIAKAKPAPKKKKSSSTFASRSGQTVKREFYVTATAYSDRCKGCTGRTATGLNLRANPSLKVIAVDPRVIKLGTKVHVEGYGYAIAADTGGAIKGNKIDVFIPNESRVYHWGRKKVKIRILG